MQYDSKDLAAYHTYIAVSVPIFMSNFLPASAELPFPIPAQLISKENDSPKCSAVALSLMACSTVLKVSCDYTGDSTSSENPPPTG